MNQLALARKKLSDAHIYLIKTIGAQTSKLMYYHLDERLFYQINSPVGPLSAKEARKVAQASEVAAYPFYRVIRDPLKPYGLDNKRKEINLAYIYRVKGVRNRAYEKLFVELVKRASNNDPVIGLANVKRYARMFQQPANRMHEVFVFQGEALGTGKSTCDAVFRACFGSQQQEYSFDEDGKSVTRSAILANRTTLLGGFNGELLNARFVSLDDMASIGAQEQAAFKSLVTADSLHVNEKYGSASYIDNYITFFGSTNEPVPYLGSDGLRRLYYIKSEYSDEAWFKEVFYPAVGVPNVTGRFKHAFIQAVAWYLEHVDISDWDIAKKYIMRGNINTALSRASGGPVLTWFEQYQSLDNISSLHKHEIYGYSISEILGIYNAEVIDGTAKKYSDPGKMMRQLRKYCDIEYYNPEDLEKPPQIKDSASGRYLTYVLSITIKQSAAERLRSVKLPPLKRALLDETDAPPQPPPVETETFSLEEYASADEDISEDQCETMPEPESWVANTRNDINDNGLCVADQLFQFGLKFASINNLKDTKCDLEKIVTEALDQYVPVFTELYADLGWALTCDIKDQLSNGIYINLSARHDNKAQSLLTWEDFYSTGVLTPINAPQFDDPPMKYTAGKYLSSKGVNYTCLNNTTKKNQGYNLLNTYYVVVDVDTQDELDVLPMCFMDYEYTTKASDKHPVSRHYWFKVSSGEKGTIPQQSLNGVLIKGNSANYYISESARHRRIV